MSNITFNVACPSCEAKIAIRSTATVGRKIECPKCKFRFVVEAPAAEPEADPKPAKGGKKPGKKTGKKEKAEKPKKGSSKVMFGAILGVLALVGLLIGAYVMIGGDDTPKPNPNPKPVAKANLPAATSSTAPSTAPTPPTKIDPTLPGVELSKVKDATNLLPGDATTVWHLRMDQLGNTPLRDLFFDANTRALFKRSMTFEAADLDEIFHAFTGPEQAPFLVLRTRGNYDQNAMMAQMKLSTPANSPIKGRKFFGVESNAFLTAVSGSLSVQSITGAGPKAKGAAKPPEKLALSMYDAQTVLVGEQAAMEHYLNDLKDDGLPPFQSDLIRPEVPAKPPEGAAPAPAAPTARKAFTSNPTYRTVKPELKKALNYLQEEGKPLPAATFAGIVNQREVNEMLSRGVPPAVAGQVTPWVQQWKVVAVSLMAMNNQKLQANAYFDYATEDDARKSALEQVLPLMNLLAPLYNERMGDAAVVRDYTMGGAPPPTDPAVPPPAGTDPPIAPPPPDSHLDLTRVDSAVVLSAELFWKKGNYQGTVVANLDRAAAQLKGRMAILGGELDATALATALPKVGQSEAGFPRGTLQQEARSDRFNMPPPPEQRVSFLAELLPFLGRGNIRAGIQEKKLAWYAADNRGAAEAWVPEFLAPHFDPSAWRATHELADGVSLGATNYVGLSGLGLDSARANPLDPAQAKKVGLYGYDWQTRPADVTDGLGNTIALIQVPPGFQRPWIAGGGATLMGVDEKGPDPLQPFIAKGADGQRGTYALMADGSVRWLKEGTDPKLFRAMVTRAGGETLDDFDKAAPKVPPKKDGK